MPFAPIPQPSFIDTGIPSAVNALNTLEQQKYANQSARQTAKYAPYTSYADAVTKMVGAQYAPLTAILSNPFALAALQQNPGALESLISKFGAGAASGQSAVNGIPQPNSGQGLMNWLTDKIGITSGGNQGASGGNALNTPPSIPSTGGTEMDAGNPYPLDVSPNGSTGNVPQASRVAPGAGGAIPGAIASTTSKFNQSPYTPGSTVGNNGDVFSTSTPESTTRDQQTIAAVTRINPILTRLASLQAPFAKVSGMAMEPVQSVVNALLPDKALMQLKKHGYAGTLPTTKAARDAELSKAPEALLRAWGLNVTDNSIAAMKDSVKPIFGETAQQYNDRIVETLKNLQNEEVAPAKERLAQGYTLNKQSNKPSEGANKLANEITLPTFNSKADFQAWYSRQPKITQDAVREHLGNR